MRSGPLRKVQRYDVIIVGAGIFGLCCAWFCREAGYSVLVIDQATPGSGASGGLVGALSPHLPQPWNEKKQFQLDALTIAPAFWQRIAQTGGIDPGYARTGRWLPLASETAAARAAKTAHAAAELWPEGFTWTPAPTFSLPAWLDAQAAPHGAVLETLSARIHPRQATAAIAKALKTRGVEIRSNTKALHAEPNALNTDGGTIPATHIVFAAGTGIPALTEPHLTGPPGNGVKGQAALLENPGDGPDRMLFADGLYIVPHADGTVAIGSTSEKEWRDPHGTDAALDALIASARTLCPPLREARILDRWAGIRPRAPKPDPLIGPVPGAPGLWFAGGGFKIGFGIAHKIGASLAAMIEGRDPGCPMRFSAQGHGLKPRPDPAV